MQLIIIIIYIDIDDLICGYDEGNENNSYQEINEMGLSTRYCVHCFKKFCPGLSEAREDKLYFFIPTIDEMHRTYFAYISLPLANAEYILAGKAGKSIVLTDYAHILHAEAGEWPCMERQQEIADFYAPLNAFKVTHEQNRLAA
jgi:hypothetical protein